MDSARHSASALLLTVQSGPELQAPETGDRGARPLPVHRSTPLKRAQPPQEFDWNASFPSSQGRQEPMSCRRKGQCFDYARVLQFVNKTSARSSANGLLSLPGPACEVAKQKTKTVAGMAPTPPRPSTNGKRAFRLSWVLHASETLRLTPVYRNFCAFDELLADGRKTDEAHVKTAAADRTGSKGNGRTLP